MDADLCLYNGAIRTMDPLAPLVEAVLIRQGRVVARGDGGKVRGLARGIPALDLGGRTATPGLEDAHLHLCAHGFSLGRLDLSATRSLDEALDAVGRAATGPSTAWLRGAGWDHNRWPVPVKPTRYDLDLVCPDQPVVLESKDLHSLWVNSAALLAAGIGAHAPDVPGGEIARDTAGVPLGILTENARRLVDAAIPQPSAHDWREAARLALADAARLGLTAVGSCEGPEAFAALASLEAEGTLPLRVWHMLPLRFLSQAIALGLRTGFGSDRLRVGHVKMFADGALGSRTAEMLAPYEGTEAMGVAATGTEELYAGALAAARAGLASAIHAIGDAANRRVLDVYERVAREVPGNGLRQRIEHVQLITPEDQYRLARLGVVASMQPVHATQDRPMAERQWGTRTAYAYPWRSLARAGARLAFGTDAPVEGLDPLAGLYAAATRRSPRTSDASWHAEQCLTLSQALLAYTHGSAWAACGERERGTLAVGKRGDVTVFSRPLNDDDPEALLDTAVDCTIVGGQVTFAR